MNIQQATALDPENPTPGIYAGVKDSKYFATKATNNSALSTIIDKTPAHYRYEKDNPTNSSSDSQMLGSVAHATLLQPERLDEDIRVIPAISKRRNDFFFALADMFPDAGIDKSHNWGQAQELIETHYPDIILVDQSHVDKSAAMIRKLKYDDREVGEWKLHTMMKNGQAEVVFIWEEPVPDHPDWPPILCKAKFDWFNFELGVGFDYKTARDASPAKFRYSISDYGYHRQLAHYFRGAEANETNLKKNAILAQESSPPYPHAWYEFTFEPAVAGRASGDEWAIANYQLETGLKKLAWCRHHEKWPGYTYHTGKNIFPIVLKYDDYRDYKDNPFTGEDDDEIEQIFSTVQDVEAEQEQE